MTGNIQKFSNLGSQIGDERPISLVRFAPNNKTLATGSWSGTVKLWNVPACTEITALRGTFYSLANSFIGLTLFTGHSDKVGGIAWHPDATLTQSKETANLVSGGGEGNVNLWSLKRCVPASQSQGGPAHPVLATNPWQ
jgi:U4/U6 small nuclear ribonucleoprotein PRP4